MDKKIFLEKIKKLPVLDTHTHLAAGKLAAGSFWEIVDYFWFARELKAAGLDADTSGPAGREKKEAFLKAYRATVNTSMNWVVRQIFRDLYGLEITSPADIDKADRMVRETSSRDDWPREVIDKLSIRKIVVNKKEDAGFRQLPGTDMLLPRIDDNLNLWLREIHGAGDQKKKAEEVAERLDRTITEAREENCPGIMTSLPFLGIKTHENEKTLKNSGNTIDEILAFLLHRVGSAASANKMFVQFFIGMEKGWSKAITSANDPQRILKLHGLFQKHACDFELVLASEINALDIVQAARIFPNVHAGGLWWFNFRESSFLDNMQKRFEALPASRCSLVVSDARSIEWCYGKILLIKRLLGEFLHGRVVSGRINEEDALLVAREWLYDSCAERYSTYGLPCSSSTREQSE